MNDLLSTNTSPQNVLDEDLVLLFLNIYGKFEQALVGAGFTREDRKPGKAVPDWGKFARHIEAQFDKESDPALMMSALTLLTDPDRPGFLREQLQEAFRSEMSEPALTIILLAVSIQQLYNELLLHINSAEGAVIEDGDVGSAMYIVEAWAFLDPEVKRVYTMQGVH